MAKKERAGAGDAGPQVVGRKERPDSTAIAESKPTNVLVVVDATGVVLLIAADRAAWRAALIGGAA